MPDWSPSAYLTFEDERTRPARDLLAQIQAGSPRHVVDLGCGPGNSTELLAARWPDAVVTGIDSSPAMIEAAQARLPALAFEEADVATWIPLEPPDVVFANAVMQWVPDHLSVLQRLARQLADGGTLAVQMPDNRMEPAHVAMVETAARHALRAQARRRGPGSAAGGRRLLRGAAAAGAPARHLAHGLQSSARRAGRRRRVGVGNGAETVLDRLDADEQAVFLADYRDRIAAAHPPARDGKVLFRFPRLFIVAQR